MDNVTERSYAQHREFEESLSVLPSCYVNPNSVDAWRHRRMLATVDSLFTAFPQAKWLTIGDGRFGSDAHYLYAHGIDVTATSLTDTSL